MGINTVEERLPVVDVPYSKRLTLNQLLEGEQYKAARQQILSQGYYQPRNGTGRRLYVQTKPIENGEHEVVAIAAVSRDPGLTQASLDLVEDFKPLTSRQRERYIQQLWRIYETEGIVNNAINKYAALLSTGGSYSIRKAKKGKKQNATEIATAVLDYFSRKVNAPIKNGVATAFRGLKALTEQGIRMALVEGDFLAREVWGSHEVPGYGKFKLPMTIQPLSMEYTTMDEKLAGIGEFWTWKPPRDFLRILRGEEKALDPLIVKTIQKTVDGDIKSTLMKNDRVTLNPALLIHVRHRGVAKSAYGESFIEPAKLGIRFLRSVMNADMVSMESVVNRLMIVMVGSSDPNSPYSDADVAASRTALMQSFFEEAGPTMTIVWQGDDVKVQTASAMDSILDLNERHKIGERKVVVALGIPSALLDGSAGDGKAAGWAALISATGQAEHLGGSFGNAWTELGERILEENGFTDLEMIYQYDRTNLADREAERLHARNDYIAGLISISTFLRAIGKDPEAEFRLRCFEQGLDPDVTTYAEAFKPPKGLPGQGEGDIQGQGNGKVPGNGRDQDSAEPPADRGKERKEPSER